MSGRNRHNKYRRSVYKKHNIGAMLLTSAVSVAVCIMVILIIGNILHAQSQSRNEDSEGNASEQAVETDTGYKNSSKKAINGYSIRLATTNDSTFSEQLDDLLSNEITEVSVPLNTPNGTLLYNSSIAKDIGYSCDKSNIAIQDVADIAKEKGFYVSGIYYVNAFSIEDELLRAVELSRSTAIISEVLRAGIDDVVIVAPEMTSNHTDEVIRFVQDIRQLADSGAIGFTVPDNIFTLEDSKQTSDIMMSLADETDFLCINAMNNGETDIHTHIGEMINREKLYLHMYNMRILLPFSDTKQSEIIRSAESNGITNWQIINN